MTSGADHYAFLVLRAQRRNAMSGTMRTEIDHNLRMLDNSAQIIPLVDLSHDLDFGHVSGGGNQGPTHAPS
jgi:hypothetical protein